jgi:predicted DNA-binding protein
MIKSGKKLEYLASVLNKNNNILISEAIEFLREEKPFEGAIGLLTSFYNKTDDHRIRKAIEGFMNDLKDQSASKEVIDEIRKLWEADTISMLVSSCWQSGLDYSDYSRDLAKIFLEGNYITAIECLTVIEESVHKLSKERKDEIIMMIKENPLSLSNEKTALTHELMSILGG